MKFVLVLAAFALWWAWKTRETKALRIGDVAAVVGALIGLRFGMKGQVPLALLSLGGAGWWYWFRRNEAPDRPLRAEQASAPQPLPGAMSPEEARAVLGVSRLADEEEIRAAHRRLLLRVHPDLGGTADQTAEANAARDALIARRS